MFLINMDCFTKRPETYSIAGPEAEAVVDALVGGLFSRFRTLEVPHQDRNFESGVFAAICKHLGIQKTKTTLLHLQSDELVKQFNRTLAKQLTILTAENQQDWGMYLPLILLTYRSAVQDSTLCNCSPDFGAGVEDARGDGIC